MDTIYYFRVSPRYYDGDPFYWPLCVAEDGSKKGTYSRTSYHRSSISNTHYNGDNDCHHIVMDYQPPMPKEDLPVFSVGSSYTIGSKSVGYIRTTTGTAEGFTYRQDWYGNGRTGNWTIATYRLNRLVHTNRGVTPTWDYESTFFRASDGTFWPDSGRDVSSSDPSGMASYASFSRGEDEFRPPTDKELDAIFDSISRELDERTGKLPPRSEVFRNAVNSISANMNNIANGIELISFINDIRSFQIGDIVKEFKDLVELNPKRLKDALASGWMGYRYSYSTTKADLEELTNYLLTYVDPNNFTNLKRYSSESNEFGTIRCKVVFSSGDPINSTLRHLETTGMMLNLYTAWDMVPLSFVVDWFLPIGDFLEDLSSNWVSQPSVFSFGEIMYSTKVKFEDQETGRSGKLYRRWIDKNPPPFETYSRDPSAKTIGKRIFDGAALLIP